MERIQFWLSSVLVEVDVPNQRIYTREADGVSADTKRPAGEDPADYVKAMRLVRKRFKMNEEK